MVAENTDRPKDGVPDNWLAMHRIRPLFAAPRHIATQNVGA